MNPRYAEVAARARHRCEYCLAPEAVFNFPFEVEHVLPPGSGGLDEPANLALACRSCNLFKSDCTEGLDAVTKRTIRLFHPRQDRWEAHFALDHDGLIVGLTEVGQVSVNQLRMNTPAQVAARIVWQQLGVIGQSLRDSSSGVWRTVPIATAGPIDTPPSGNARCRENSSSAEIAYA